MEMIDKNLTVVEKRIKFLRDLKAISQEELAQDLNVARSTVNSWENGYANISLKQLIHLAGYYKVPVDYILGLITQFNRDDYNFKEVLDLKYLGKNLRILRKMENLNQSEFAKRIKTKPSNISYYESGKMAMSTADFKDICNTFGYSADWLVGNINKCLRRDKKIQIKEEEIREFIEL